MMSQNISLAEELCQLLPILFREQFRLFFLVEHLYLLTGDIELPLEVSKTLLLVFLLVLLVIFFGHIVYIIMWHVNSFNIKTVGFHFSISTLGSS